MNTSGMPTLVSQRNVRFIEVVLNLVWYVQWTTAIIFTIVLLVGSIKNDNTFDRFPIRFSFPMEFEQEQLGRFMLPDGSKVPAQMQIERVQLKLPSRSLALAPWGIMALLSSAVFFGVLYLLRKIVASVKADQPFSRENWWRVRLLGFIIAGKAVAGSIVSYLAHNYFGSRVQVKGMTIGPAEFDLDGEWILMGLMLILLAEIFKAGAVLQEERELTI